MGFLDNFGNWIWDGVILNVVFGAIAGLILAAVWLGIYGLLRLFAENEVYQGLLSSDEDHPLRVAVLCLITPPLFVIVIGTLIGLIYATILNVLLLFWNLIPFFGWGASNGQAHFDNLTHVYQLPVNFLDWCYYLFMATPSFTVLALGVIAIACFGLLIPRRKNTSSLGNSNKQYAALSISMFASIFSVTLIIFFSSFMNGLYLDEIQQYWGEMADQHQSSEENVWYPNYTFQSAEGHEFIVEEFDAFYYESETLVNTKYGTSGKFHENSLPGGAIECLSLNSVSDHLDAFLIRNVANGTIQKNIVFQVQIQSTHPLNVSVLSKNSDDGLGILEDHQYYPHATNLGMEFSTSELWNFTPDSQSVHGFFLEQSHNTTNDFPLTKYNIVYADAAGGNLTNQTLAKYSEEVGDPTDCEKYALSGAIEPRFRMTAMAYVFIGMFLFGCVLNRYYVIILGNNGETDPRVLFRTFTASQIAAVGVYGILLLIFDPLDGMGITGLTWDTILQTTFFVSKLGIFIVVILIAAIGLITLYRQRQLIGDSARAMYGHEQLMGQVEREWFGG
jgi:hypothetical protein